MVSRLKLGWFSKKPSVEPQVQTKFTVSGPDEEYVELGIDADRVDRLQEKKQSKCMEEPSLQKLVDYFLLPWETPVLGMRVFRSQQAIIQEIERQKKINRYIIHRMSRFRSIWDIFMVTVLFVTLVVLPVELAFFTDNLQSSKWKVFNIFLDVCFMLDIVINFRSTYVQSVTEEMILDNRSIVINYLKTWFVLDLVSSLPLDYMYLAFSGADASEHLVLTRTLRVLRLSKLLSLLRIFRFVRFMRYIRMIEEAMKFEGRIISILNVVVGTLVYAHWNGCIQWFVPFLLDYPQDCWIVLGDLRNDSVSIWTRYTHSVYRALSHMVSIGYGATRPVNNSDIWTTMVSMVCGATFYALFIGHVSAMVSDMNYSGRKYEERITEVKEYMKFRKLPVSLQRRILDYYEHRYQRKMFDEKSILSEINMSKPLKDNIMMHNCRNLVESVPFLSNSPHDFILDIIVKLHMEVYFPGETIIKYGRKGDAMFFIEHGRVEVVMPNGKVIRTLQDGMYFGEIALLFEEKRVASVIATEMCDIYFLSKVDFNAVVAEYPEMHARMFRCARRRLQSIVDKGFESEGLEKILTDQAELDNSANVQEQSWEALMDHSPLDELDKEMLKMPMGERAPRRSGIQVDNRQHLGNQDHYMERQVKSHSNENSMLTPIGDNVRDITEDGLRQRESHTSLEDSPPNYQ